MSDEFVSYCCYCGEPCNSCSQAHSSCAKQYTFVPFQWVHFAEAPQRAPPKPSIIEKIINDTVQDHDSLCLDLLFV
jgi:hypothetical protein